MDYDKVRAALQGVAREARAHGENGDTERAESDHKMINATLDLLQRKGELHGQEH